MNRRIVLSLVPVSRVYSGANEAKKKGLARNKPLKKVARMTRLELATPSVTGWCSNQLSYTPTKETKRIDRPPFNSR